MRKIKACFIVCLFIWVLMGMCSVVSQRKLLNEGLIRLHVVANSDSAEDQKIKLLVRDAVTQSFSAQLSEFSDVEQAKEFIRNHLQEIQAVANNALKQAGVDSTAVVSFAKERFDTRFYDTFRLPAGIYESLRISIGEGVGKNWWCVVFPTFCIPATSDGFETVAAGAGFDGSLVGALEGEKEYEIRFFLLDLLGKGENMFFRE